MRTRILFAAVLFGLCLPPFAHAIAQAQGDRLTFEAASIKPTVTQSGGVSGGCRAIDSKIAADDPRATVPLGRCVVTAGRLSHLMAMAFQMPLQRISGFPDWDGPSRFDLQAKAEDPATATDEQLLGMFQRFLIERFKLTLHRETKDGPTFSLLVAKNGPKNLKPSTENGESMTPRGTSLMFKGYTMLRLAEFLSPLPSVQRPVTDMTGLSGRFDFSIEMLAATPGNGADLKTAIVAWDTIFSDVQEQLGLKLEPSKGEVEVLVIDHVERPTEN